MNTKMSVRYSSCTPVTLIYVPDSYIQQVKSIQTDGHVALQLASMPIPRPTPNKRWKNIYEARDATLDIIKDKSKEKVDIEDLTNLLYVDIQVHPREKDLQEW